MEHELTRNASYVLARHLKLYHERIHSGMDEEPARFFAAGKTIYPDLREANVFPAKRELCDCGIIKMDILGNITLTDTAVSIHENFFKHSLEKIAAFLAQFI